MSNGKPMDSIRGRKPLPLVISGKAGGITILYSFNRCGGPILGEEAKQNVEKAFTESRVNVMKLTFARYSDDTINCTADLAESHAGLGTYRVPLFVRGDITMCFESTDNTGLAFNLVYCLWKVFKPKNYVLDASFWQSR